MQVVESFHGSSHNGVLCSQNICLHIQRSMAHITLSVMVPPSLSKSSPLTCTPIRPSTRPSTGFLHISSSDEIYHCDDPINVSFSLADLHSVTGYESKDLAEEDKFVQVKPSFFHRPSVTSTYDSAEEHRDSPS